MKRKAAFLDMTGYSREDLSAERMRWTDTTPAEWVPASQQAMLRMRAAGSCEPFEKEYFRKYGSRMPVLVGAAALGRDEAVAFVLDLTERKQAEGRQKLLLDERRRAEYLTRQVFESAPDGVCIVGRDATTSGSTQPMSGIGECRPTRSSGSTSATSWAWTSSSTRSGPIWTDASRVTKSAMRSGSPVPSVDATWR
jgi:PAS domain S-box-containing protein